MMAVAAAAAACACRTRVLIGKSVFDGPLLPPVSCLLSSVTCHGLSPSLLTCLPLLLQGAGPGRLGGLLRLPAAAVQVPGGAGKPPLAPFCLQQQKAASVALAATWHVPPLMIAQLCPIAGRTTALVHCACCSPRLLLTAPVAVWLPAAASRRQPAPRQRPAPGRRAAADATQGRQAPAGGHPTPACLCLPASLPSCLPALPPVGPPVGQPASQPDNRPLTPGGSAGGGVGA
jgi:hypothetical protein